MHTTQNWNGPFESALKHVYKTKYYQPITCLDIDAFEGKSSTLIHEYLCNHKDSLLYCIDPWNDEYTDRMKDLNHYFVGQYKRFIHNTKDCNKIRPIKDTSNNAFKYFEEKLDMVFIDGDHSPDQVYLDGVNCLKLMKDGGYMFFDDYNWTHNGVRCGDGIDKFLREFEEYITVIYKEQALVVQVVKPVSVSFDVYAINWNEEKLLPYFFNHYKQARRIYVLDNKSTDKSIEIIQEYGGEIISFDTDGIFDDVVHREHKNHIWKQSRGFADYVIVQDLDEFLFFPKFGNNIKAALLDLKLKKITICRTTGYNMYCDDEFIDKLPRDSNLSASIFNGNLEPFSGMYNKQIVFNPNKINEINYEIGAHKCCPIGDVTYQDKDDITLLLHYKFLGRNNVLNRYKLLQGRNSIAHQYSKNLNQTEYIDNVFKNYSKTSIFRSMYPDTQYSEIIFNSKKCIVHTFDSSDIISNSIMHKAIWEPLVANYIKYICQKHSVVFVDVGANLGLHSIAAKLSEACYVYAFECNYYTYIRLKDTININGWKNVKVVNKAVSNETDKTLCFYQVTNNMGASFIECKDNQFNNDCNIVTRVNTVKLDDYIDEFARHEKSSKSCLCIKIDVEGHELEALQGMIKMLECTKYVIIELNPYTQTVDKLKQVVELLSSHFYHIYKIMEVPNDGWSGPELHCAPFYTPISVIDIMKKMQSNVILEVIFCK